MKKRNKLMTCLIAGVVILSVSAVAAFGSVNGYSNYKNAVKALALEEENFSLDGTMVMTVDGKEVLSMGVDAKLAVPNSALVTSAKAQGMEETQYEYQVDGVCTGWSSDSDYYYQYDNGYNTTTILNIDDDDEMSQRMINFMEIAADTVVGDLKNNFVEVGSENGSKLYQVNISNAQVPALVNSGLSLFAYVIANDSQPNYTTMYEDYDAAMFQAYEKATGETLSQEFKDGYAGGGYDAAWAVEYEDTMNAMHDAFNEQDNKYYEMLDQKGGGIVYIRADGSYKYYAEYRDYLEENGGGDFQDDLYYYVGQDMVLDNVNCTFGIDKAGHLTTNHYVVTFTTTDDDGGKHELVITVDGTFSDYGTTVVTAPQIPAGLKDGNAMDEPQSVEVTTEEVPAEETAEVFITGENAEATSFPEDSESSSF